VSTNLAELVTTYHQSGPPEGVFMLLPQAARVVRSTNQVAVWRPRWYVGMALRYGTPADVARALGRGA